MSNRRTATKKNLNVRPSNKPIWRGTIPNPTFPTFKIPEAKPLRKSVFVPSVSPEDYIVYAHRQPQVSRVVIESESFNQKSPVQIPKPNITSDLAETQVKLPEITSFNNIPVDVVKDDLPKDSIFGQLLAGAVIIGLIYKLRKPKAV